MGKRALIGLLFGLLAASAVPACGGDDDAGLGNTGGSGSGGKDAGSGGKGGSATGGSDGGGTGGTGGGTGGAGGATGGTGGATPCTGDGECPATSNECLAPKCENNVCTTEPLAVGTPAATQTPNDCKRVECDGAGSTQSVPDDTDIKDDGNACTEDGCAAGAETHPNEPVGTICNTTDKCDGNGKCVKCLGASDCGTATDCATPVCANGACSTSYAADGTAVPLQTAGNCKKKVCDGGGGTKDVNDAADVPNDNNVCTIDSCNAGAPVHTPDPNKSCGTNQVCNAAGQCVGCNVPTDCQGTDDFCKTRTCNSGVCGFAYTNKNTPLPTQTAGDCKTMVCDGAGSIEPIAAVSDLPVDGKECTNDVCTGSTPSNPPVGAGSACASGTKVCDGGGACVACLTPANCANPPGFPCVVATCVSNSCGTANASPSTTCGGGTCSAGVAHLVDKCDGSGNCVDAGTQNCAPYVCGPASCNTSCGSDQGCSVGTCDTGIGICTTGPKCTDYCKTIETNCTAGNDMYFSEKACLDTCAKMPKGAATDQGGNTVGCRAYHAGAAGGDPVTHCPHAGPTGDGVCGGTCESFCTIAQLACTGAQQVYASHAACMTACGLFAATPKYNAGVVSGDSYACRMYHLTNAVGDPVGHCAHIAPVSGPCS